jgi:hypothetical protein
MLEGSMRRGMARGEITDGVVLHREFAGPESAGYGPRNQESAGPKIQGEKILGEEASGDALWRDAEGLVAIASRHAALALANPPDVREAYLVACRAVWTTYATAFNTSVAKQRQFADELLDATRGLMAAQQESDEAPPESDEAPPEPDAEPRPIWSPKVPASLITLEELRLILSQIIRQ